MVSGDNIVGQEVNALMRLSEARLLQVENGMVENDKEPDLFGGGNSDNDEMVLRFTDLDLMDRSVMTIPADDMSSWSGDLNFCDDKH